MSTRCQIKVEGSDVYVYRHSDGYPDGEHGVIAALKPLCEEFLKYRGWDEEYLPAHIVSGFIVAYVAHMRERYEDKDFPLYADMTPEQKEERINQSKFLGHGVDTEMHGDIEYLYVVTREGIEVRHVGRFGVNEEDTEFVKFGEEYNPGE